MKLELSDDEALVLFEWLARLDEKNALPVEDEAEEQVLWKIHGQLEKVLREPFAMNYRELVAAARVRIKRQWGG